MYKSSTKEEKKERLYYIHKEYTVTSVIYRRGADECSGVEEPYSLSKEAADTSVYYILYILYTCQTAAGWTGCGLGWLLSLRVIWALCRHLISLISLMLSNRVSMMFWAVLISHCRAFRSWAVHIPCQFVFPVRMLSIATKSEQELEIFPFLVSSKSTALAELSVPGWIYVMSMTGPLWGWFPGI